MASRTIKQLTLRWPGCCRRNEGSGDRSRPRTVTTFLAACLLGASVTGTAVAQVQPGEYGLEQLIQLALQKNPQMGIARSSLDEAQARVGQNQSSYYPQVSLDMRVEQVTLNAATPTDASYYLDFGQFGKVLVDQPDSDMSGYRRGTASLSVEYLLYDFGRRSNSVQSAVESAGVAQAGLSRTANDTMLQVVNAYFTVLRAEELLSVEQESRNRKQEAVRLAGTLRDAGRGTAGDVARADADLSQAELNVIKAENEIELARLNLRRTVGLPPDGKPMKIVSSSRLKAPAKITSQVDELVERALSQRPEMEAQQRTIAANKAAVERQRADYYPTLNAYGSYSVQQYEDTDSAPNYTAGLQLRWSLFDGSLRKNKVGEARARLMQEQDRLNDLQLNIAKDVRDAQQRFQEARERLALSRKVLKSSELDLKLARQGYKEGIRSFYDLSVAEGNYRSARAQQVVADYDLQIAIARLYWALGGIDILRQQAQAAG